MFNLTNQEAFLIYSPRVEKHGTENSPGCTLNIKISGPNSLLDLLDPDLLPRLFKPKPKEDQDLDDMGQGEYHMPMLRFPNLQKSKKVKQFEWGYENGGYRTIIGGGLFSDQDLIFIQCEIKAFTFTLHDGGTVDITFNINCDPSKEEAGELYKINGQQIDLTLEPPSPEEQAQMELDAQQDGHDYGHVQTQTPDDGSFDKAEEELKNAFDEEEVEA